MSKVATLTSNNLAESLFRLMRKQEPPDRRKNKIVNGAQEPSGAKNASRGGRIRVRYTCVSGETTKILTLEEPRYAAPRATCPGCPGVTIEGRGLIIKPMCYWEIVG